MPSYLKALVMRVELEYKKGYPPWNRRTITQLRIKSFAQVFPSSLDQSLPQSNMSVSHQLTRSLALGLLCSLPLLNPVLTASIPPRDDVVIPHSAIAVKLSSNPNTSAFRTTASSTSLTGAKLVEDLIRKAHPVSARAKAKGRRDVDFTVSPLITSLSAEKIAEMVQRASTLDPTYEPADFGSWYRVQFPEPAQDAPSQDIIQLLKNLGQYQEVASAERLASARLPAVQPNDDPKFAEQGYLRADGINAEYAWGFPGGDGAGTTVIDVERGWQLNHEDLVRVPFFLVYP